MTNRIESAECSSLATSGTRIISPQRDLEIRKALMRYVRRRKLRLKIELFILYIRKFSLDLRYARVLARRRFGGYLGNFLFNFWHRKAP